MESNASREYERWKQEEDAADQMIPLIGHLYRRQNVISTFFGKGLVHKNGLEIIQLHDFVCEHVRKTISPSDTLILLQAIVQHAGYAYSMRIDLGRTFILVEPFVVDYKRNMQMDDAKSHIMKSLAAFLDSKLEAIADSLHLPRSVDGTGLMQKPSDVILYGFGRIGRLLARLLIEKSGPGVKLMLRAIVVRRGTREDVAKRANLLKLDSVHGPFLGTIKLDEEANAFIANGNLIHIIYSDAPDKCDYKKYGIDDAVVIDNTGKWRDKEGLQQHLNAPGVSKVILTAPGKGEIPTLVAGVNEEQIVDEVAIYSAASCTTNAIAPTLLALEQKYGIIRGHIETVHSFTNDQNLIDNYHTKERRGRSAVLNMVITETGAAEAVVKCLPSLKGKLTANAIRVPTPNVSLAILNIELSHESAQNLTVEEINAYMCSTSINSPLQNQIDFVNSAEVASSDFVGYRAAGIIDGKASIVQGNKVILYVWYDNEFGYSCQVIRVLQKLKGIVHLRFPDENQASEIDRLLGLSR
ncbi:unnamed protein product [Albugo candida]|uniref:Glyceraldehyde 3-phosphate dehydrogenase NAD(P) binding domain-containing protein n=1 Tax=Albugo candida TaxID=65357 RepID=A0A024FWW4_9STRA|nr:unnamed protein product [Albugo candida]|eukprot:CCI11154.1 unnamed protein product [Albugo candida]